MRQKTMQKLICALIALNIVVMIQACAPKTLEMQNASTHADLTLYLESFKHEARANGVQVDDSHLKMSFSETMPKSTIKDCPNCQVIAYCQNTSIGPNIVFKTSAWKQWPNSVREFVAFHELAHCLLDSDHNDSMEWAVDYDTGERARLVPSSIMNELIFDSFVYESNRKTYVQRLFGHAIVMPLTLGGPSQFEDIY